MKPDIRRLAYYIEEVVARERLPAAQMKLLGPKLRKLIQEIPGLIEAEVPMVGRWNVAVLTCEIALARHIPNCRV
jgi:hypothetical protein